MRLRLGESLLLPSVKVHPKEDAEIVRQRRKRDFLWLCRQPGKKHEASLMILVEVLSLLMSVFHTCLTWPAAEVANCCCCTVLASACCRSSALVAFFCRFLCCSFPAARRQCQAHIHIESLLGSLQGTDGCALRLRLQFPSKLQVYGTESGCISAAVLINSVQIGFQIQVLTLKIFWAKLGAAFRLPK